MGDIFYNTVPCRICLKIVDVSSHPFGWLQDDVGSLKEMVMSCIPEMDIYVSSEPIVCFPCIQELARIHNFKMKCINTETIIRSYMKRNNLLQQNHVNLFNVVQDLISPDNAIYGNQRKSKTKTGHTKSTLPIASSSHMPTIHIPNENGTVFKDVPSDLISTPQVSNQPIAQFNAAQPPPLTLLQQNNSQLNSDPMESVESFLTAHLISKNQTVTSNGGQVNVVQNKPTVTCIKALHTAKSQLVRKVPSASRLRNILAPAQVFSSPPPLVRLDLPDVQTKFNDLLQTPDNDPQAESCEPSTNPFHDELLASSTPPIESPVESLTVDIASLTNNTAEKDEQSEATVPIPPTELNAKSVIADNCVTEMPEVPEAQSVITNDSVKARPNDSKILDDKPPVESSEEPVTKKMKLVIKIPRCLIKIPLESLGKNKRLVKTNTSRSKRNINSDINQNENEGKESGEAFEEKNDDNKKSMTPIIKILKLPELYKCPNCTFATTCGDTITRHRCTCVIVPTKEKKEKKNCFECPHCTYTAHRRSNMEVHINSVHTKLIWYTCEDCHFKTTNKPAYQRHLNKYHPQQIFQCHHCAYRSRNECDMEKHMERHQGKVDPFQCQYCSHTCKDKTKFKKHIYTHNPKKIMCEFCKFSSLSPYNMVKHLKMYHNGVGVEDINIRKEINEVFQEVDLALKETAVNGSNME